MTHAHGNATATTGQGLPDCAWLIRQFAEDVPGVTHAMLVSLDGLQLAASRGVHRDLGDQLSALTAGLLSMADRSAALLDLGSSEYLTVRLPRGHLLFMRVGESAGLAVAAAPGCDLRVVSYRMTQFVGAVWHALTPQVRHELHRMTASQPR
ncbi:MULTISPECIES: roadblock/LC7 domain-containing protein [Micromonospora]|uniref:Dynein regulation protein LC7 n=1 Tax=Micromonospora sicca TaxID=2202420 RepID=A0A317DGU1_9ACTN|nr:MULTISPECIES: roadblock/LC7 domain-containing protein [unclassified Micromonospora]MBM0227817.1 roadblock/LC7 domain-containing protein [Micromonospora sp. ATA51]PWR13664.1 dynein regulation protein LC7 [Micromonospora sp. 4G51]